MPFFRRVSRKGEEDTAAMLSPDQVGALWSPGHLTMPPARMTALIQRGTCRKRRNRTANRGTGTARTGTTRTEQQNRSVGPNRNRSRTVKGSRLRDQGSLFFFSSLLFATFALFVFLVFSLPVFGLCSPQTCTTTKHNPTRTLNKAFPVLKLYYNHAQSNQDPKRGISSTKGGFGAYAGFWAVQQGQTARNRPNTMC